MLMANLDRYLLTDRDLDEVSRRTGEVYDHCNVALALLDDPQIPYRARKNLETAIMAAREANSANHTELGMSRLAADQVSGRADLREP
jgi:hypothetical protein